MLAAIGGPAFAASAVNLDSEPRTLIVTEGGSKSELAVGAGETVEFCPSGCFVTLPNGDREALTGSETIEISGGQAQDQVTSRAAGIREGRAIVRPFIFSGNAWLRLTLRKAARADRARQAGRL